MDPVNDLRKLAIDLKNDFRSVDVRRLHGIFNDFKGWAGEALEIMNTWIDEKEYDVTFEEALKRLQYHLDRLGIK